MRHTTCRPQAADRRPFHAAAARPADPRRLDAAWRPDPTVVAAVVMVGPPAGTLAAVCAAWPAFEAFTTAGIGGLVLAVPRTVSDLLARDAGAAHGTFVHDCDHDDNAVWLAEATALLWRLEVDSTDAFGAARAAAHAAAARGVDPAAVVAVLAGLGRLDAAGVELAVAALCPARPA